jgi:AcrR family transcriptional regulator
MPDRPVPPPLRRDAERNRQRILHAARRLYARAGLATGYDEIAREAEVGVGTVYRRFPQREDLLSALFQDGVDQVVGLARTALEHPDPWQGLCTFLEETLSLQAGDRGLRELLVGTQAPTALARSAQQRIAPLVAELVERSQAAGLMRPDVGVQDIALAPLMVGAVIDRARGVDPDLWRRTLALLLDGFRAGPVGPLPAPAPTAERFARILGGETGR